MSRQGSSSDEYNYKRFFDICKKCGLVPNCYVMKGNMYPKNGILFTAHLTTFIDGSHEIITLPGLVKHL